MSLTRIMNKKYILAIILSFCIVESGFSTKNIVILDLLNNQLGLKKEWEKDINTDYILNSIYPHIDFVSSSPLIKGEDMGRPIWDEKGFIDYYYRCVVVNGEDTDYLFIEKWGVEDEEIQNVKIINQAYIPLSKIIDTSSEKYYREYIEKIEWIDSYRFILVVNEKLFEFKIKE